MIDTDKIASMIDIRRRNGQSVFVCGNGGSATTAEHFTNDLFAKGVRAICLNSNTAIMTMIANDHGYEHVFDKQLSIHTDPGDLLVVFSCSGTSLNILNALKEAERGLVRAIRVFGGNGNYQEMENEHLRIAHEVVGKL